MKKRRIILSAIAAFAVLATGTAALAAAGDTGVARFLGNIFRYDYAELEEGPDQGMEGAAFNPTHPDPIVFTPVGSRKAGSTIWRRGTTWR